MNGLRSFGRFWWDFVIGDDWRLAFASGAALAITAAVSRTAAAAWWITPTAVVAVLVSSVRRQRR